MSDPTSDTGQGIVDLCREHYEQAPMPVLVVNPANARIVYSNPAFSALVKPGMLDEPRERLSDILKHGLQNDFREQMIDAIKEPEEPREGEILLKEEYFLSEKHTIRLAYLPFEETDYIEITFAGSEESAEDPSAGGDAGALQGRITALEKESADKDLMYQRFAHLVGHELKAPLTALKGYSELLEYQFRESGDADTLEILGMINKSCARLHKSIDALYHVGVQDMLDRRYKTADLQKVLSAVAAELEVETAGTGHALRLDETKARLKTNPVLLQEMLYQLVLFELLQAQDPSSTIHILFRQVDEGYGFMVRHSLQAEESFPENIAELIDALQPPENDRRAVTIGCAMASKLIEQAGGRVALERGEQGRNAYYLMLPKAGG